MSRDSNTHTVSVTAPAGTALSALAASMTVGTWAALSTTSQNTFIGSQSGASGSLIHYGNGVSWNPISKVIEIVACDHQGATPSMEHVRYTDSTNAYSRAQSLPCVPGIGHNYDHTVVNPTNGDLYHTLYAGFTGSIQVYRKTFGASTFSSIGSINPISDQVSHGSCWWSGTFTGTGVQGCWLVYDNGNGTGQLRAYNPLTSTWFYSSDSASPGANSGGDYHTVCEYSAIKNVAVYGGGGTNFNRLWKIDSARTITALTNVPSGKQVGIQQGNLVCDPVTGNFLLLSAGQLWELNPTGSGTWTQQTGSRAPPGGVGNPTAPDGVVSTAISTYGVIAYITQTTGSGGTTYLYKHA